MSAETKLDIISESPTRSPKPVSPLDRDTVDMVFGSPNSPKTEPAGRFKNEKDSRIPNKDADVVPQVPPSQPLLEPDREKQKPPLAGPEVDDLDESPPVTTPYPGIDDGLLDPAEKKPENDGEGSEHDSKEQPSTLDGGDGKWNWAGADEPDYPYELLFGGKLKDKVVVAVHMDPGHSHTTTKLGNGLDLDTRYGDRPISPALPPASEVDVNTYQQKKNLAQGMMDLALLSANANQLRYVLESSTAHPYFYPSLVFISMSILLQVAVGVGLIMNSRYDVNHHKEICKADKINNMTVLGVFLVTIVNVFITSFSVATPNTVVNGV